MKLLQLLCELQVVDQEWDEKGQLYQATRQRLGDESALQLRRKAKDEAAENLRATTAQLRDAELELATLQQKAQEVSESLYGGRVKAFKELEDLRLEAEQLKKRIGSMEDWVIEQMEEADVLEALVTQLAEGLRVFEQEWATEHEQLAHQYRSLRARLQELKARREELRSSIGSTDLALYDELRHQKAGPAVAPVKDGICQACRVMVPSYKVQVVLTDDTIVLCEGCGRILCQS